MQGARRSPMNVPFKFIPPRTSGARKATRVVLPIQPVKTDSVRAFMRDYMVSHLAKEFLRLREGTLSAPNEVKDEKRAFQPFGKEGGL